MTMLESELEKEAPMEAERQETAMTNEANIPAPPTGTMRAVVQDAYGSPDVFRLSKINIPEVADQDVLVRVQAAGLDRGTWHLMAGRPYLVRLAVGLRRPKQPVPGIDLAGTVAAVGPAVTRFSPGDEVFGTGKGSFAEYAVAPEDQLASKPAGLSFEEAAVVPVSGLTALQALTDVGHLQPGQQVLIIGASGGVGSYAVQLAKALGAEVTGVSSSTKLDLVRSLGSDHVIDYTNEDFADGAHRYDLILDIGGNPTLARLRRALTPAGTAVIVGGEHDGRWIGGMDRLFRAFALSPFVRQRLTFFVSKETASDLERLTEFIEAGKLTPSLDRTYPLAQAAGAMRHLEAGKARGKIAITV
jgi:NADPH:quinone reductase-like Zn-dependent oxidoreductase